MSAAFFSATYGEARQRFLGRRAPGPAPPSSITSIR